MPMMAPKLTSPPLTIKQRSPRHHLEGTYETIPLTRLWVHQYISTDFSVLSFEEQTFTVVISGEDNGLVLCFPSPTPHQRSF